MINWCPFVNILYSKCGGCLQFLPYNCTVATVTITIWLYYRNNFTDRKLWKLWIHFCILYIRRKCSRVRYFIISWPRASRKLCPPRLCLEPATFELLDRCSTNWATRSNGLQTGNYELYTESQICSYYIPYISHSRTFSPYIYIYISTESKAQNK